MCQLCGLVARLPKTRAAFGSDRPWQPGPSTQTLSSWGSLTLDRPQASPPENQRR
ncbi:hypothetical protein [Leptolyngbya sp. CCY15150]|uniref:hypothetical protein n=1 Tax=Leptolyngbya sp. CCY15150 TaxID=2767772 RepID=UPI0019514889|nr:hypothetical protein [Leptolyngbya sp. CCY15150]